jgi:integrase
MIMVPQDGALNTMLSSKTVHRPDLADPECRSALPVRLHPYWSLLEYCRHVGYQKRANETACWMVRVRTTAGKYKQHQLGIADSASTTSMSYTEAVAAARAWFRSPAICRIAAEAYPLGARQELTICPIGEVFTVGHALHDYMEWKRIAAARSHFETNLSLINHHIIPRLAEIPLERFNGIDLRHFAKAVLETPPKRGNQPARPRRPISQISEDALRKRKKTLNTLIGILRIAFQMAWENGRIENDRAWRCLRRVPNVERPRMLFLTRAECQQLLAECRPDLRQLVMGALYSGCRSTELLRLTVADVARDGYGIYVAPLKTYRPRFVFLPDEGMAFFLFLCRSRGPREPVFVRGDGAPWQPRHHRHLFKRAVRMADLPEEFTFHGLRHTYASQLVQAGTPLSVIAGQLGHANSTTVSRTYGHLAPQIREAEVRHRFAPLCPESASATQVSADQLTDLRNRLHGPDWRSYAQISDSSSWPRSNFYRGDAALVRLCRGQIGGQFQSGLTDQAIETRMPGD